MRTILYRPNMATCIPIDADAHNSLPLPAYTGSELLALRLPRWDFVARYVEPVKCRPVSKNLFIMNVEDVDSANWIPPTETVAQAHSAIFEKDVYGARFFKYGFVAKPALPLLLRRCHVTKFANELQGLKQWLTEHLDVYGIGFLGWFQLLLETQSNIMEFTFQQKEVNVQLHINQTFCLKNEDFLNDDIVRVIFRLFEHYYRDGFLFIPSLGFENWMNQMSP
ncbi:hypothetical protein BGZ65_006675, partial [Modicella reniformis]